MGADFLVNFITIDQEKDIDIEAGRRTIDALAAAPLEQWPSEFLDAELCGGEPDPPDEERMREFYVSLLRSDLQIVEDEIDEERRSRRDVWSGGIGTKRVIMSGGMSWGDSPTEAFDSLERLSRAGISRAMGFDW